MSKQLDKLLQQLINLHPKYIDLSLDRLLKLLKKLDNPHLKIPPVIHIAGTNGKGSTLSYIHHILIKYIKKPLLSNAKVAFLLLYTEKLNTQKKHSSQFSKSDNCRIFPC